MKISLKSGCGQEEVVQLVDVNRGLGLQANGWKVIILLSNYFGAQNTGTL